MTHDMTLKGIREGLAKKIASVATAGILAVSLMPLPAYASAGADSDGGWFDLPTSAKSLDHTATVGGKSVSYRFMSSGIERTVGGFSQSMYYLMGINGVNFDRGLRANVHPWTTVSSDGSTLHARHTVAVDGIMGTDVNVEPDEYLWNSCYLLHAHPQDASALTNANADVTSVYVKPTNGNTSVYETIPVQINGVEEKFPVNIYYEANIISTTDNEWSGTHTLADWVALENQRPGRPSVPETYAPYTAAWTTNSGGINYNVQLMYELASTVDSITAASKDANGNPTVMSRYVDALGNDRTGLKADSALELAQNYEDFNKATQYYMIGKLKKAATSKKVTAVIVGYQPANASTGEEASYACRIYDYTKTGIPANESGATLGARLANAVMNMSTDINTVLGESRQSFAPADSDKNKVVWYYASDIVKNADAVFVSDCPQNNNRADYLATNKNNERLSTYSTDNDDFPQTNDNINPLLNAATAAGSGAADIYYKFPSHLFGVWYAQGFENGWLGPLAASYLYGDVFTSPENVMAYAAKNFWHIKPAQVNNVLAATCYDISMPSGKTFGTPDSNYQDVIDTIMEQGNGYYLSSRSVMSEINAMNTGDLVTYDVAALNERTPDVTVESDKAVMHRLYNSANGEHFYTANDTEWRGLLNDGWNDEGTGWIAPVWSNTPVYRVRNVATSEHFYTTSASERDGLVASRAWADEGIGWYSDDAKSKQLFRLNNPRATMNSHHYTASYTEMVGLLRQGWDFEGTAWYGLNA